MKTHTNTVLTKAVWLLFYLYIMLLCYFLFFSEHYGRDYVSDNYRYNLELFKEIKRFITYREQLGFESFVVNILGNVLAFMPFGFLLPQLHRRYNNFFRSIFASLLFTTAVETMQLLFKVGIFDVDDIMLNTLGGFLGYLIYFIFRGIHHGFQPKKLKNGRK